MKVCLYFVVLLSLRLNSLHKSLFVELFEVFAVKVIQKNILDQLITRPTKEQLKECREMLVEIIKTKNCGPIMVRGAWHDSGTYDDYIGQINWPHCGGANGLIRYQVDDPANVGLNILFEILQPCKDKFPSISWSDLIQMASATSIELAGEFHTLPLLLLSCCLQVNKC